MKFKEKRKIDEESQDNLRQRYRILSEMLLDKSTDEETRKAVIDEMKFIKSQEKERRFEKFSFGPVVGALITVAGTFAAAAFRYRLDNKGIYSKDGDTILRKQL